MATVVARFSNVTTKVQVGAAAVALAATATIAPAVVAEAQPGGIAPIVQSVGASASDDTLWFLDNAADGRSASGIAAPSAALLAPATITSIFQNRFFWFGTPNPTPPPGATVFEFTPLPLIPGFLRPLYGWFTQNLNFEACILGATIKIGPYGTVSGSLTRGC
jgi:hypothetical protein